jgi:hypothetical protein
MTVAFVELSTGANRRIFLLISAGFCEFCGHFQATENAEVRGRGMLNSRWGDSALRRGYGIFERFAGSVGTARVRPWSESQRRGIVATLLIYFACGCSIVDSHSLVNFCGFLCILRLTSEILRPYFSHGKRRNTRKGNVQW